MGRTSLKTTAIFQALADKGARRRESEMGLNDVREAVKNVLAEFVR